MGGRETRMVEVSMTSGLETKRSLQAHMQPWSLCILFFMKMKKINRFCKFKLYVNR
jgi:hypothetical protein